jgi:beta-aspartyl-peptidase (threonine type)
MSSHNPIILVHGGAGVPIVLDRQMEAAARAALASALDVGFGLLKAGESALNAVEAAVRTMEDDPIFNAGVGAALTSLGHAEHDASIMDGSTRAAGSVTGTRRVRNPITLARRVLETSPHVCLSAAGAEQFAINLGIPLVDPGMFVTQRRMEALQRVRASSFRPERALDEQDMHGTVGAVALDAHGHLAAATSTGGRTNKWPGRVGDSASIGAGTYADDRTVAVSCTGNGEYFMRCVTAHKVSALVELGQLSIEDAAARAIAEIKELGGTGGLIAVDADGNPAMSFNSHGMYRGIRDSSGRSEVFVV